MGAEACVWGSHPPYLHVWSEHLSSPSRRRTAVSRQVPPTLSGEGMHTLSTLYSYLIALPLEKRRSTHTKMQAARFPLVSLFFALVVFPHHSFIILLSHKHFTSNSRISYFLFNKMFVILFTCCASLSGTVHFCAPEGIHWTVLMERGS